jgi:hypothetical protein
MYFMKTEVYSWRVSAELKTMLEREVRRSKTPVSERLDLAVHDLLQAGAPNAPDDEKEQRQLRTAGLKCVCGFALSPLLRLPNNPQPAPQLPA